MFSSAIKNYLTSYSGLPLTAWQRIAISFFNTIASGLTFFLSLYLVNILHIEIATAGIIISCYGIGRTLGGIIGGKLSDIFSPGIISIGSLIIEGCCFLLLGECTAVNILIVITFTQGLAAYGFQTSNNLWILNHCEGNEARKLKIINIIFAASNLGVALSAIIVGLFSSYGFKYIFLSVGILILLLAVYLMIQENQLLNIKTIPKITSDHPASSATHAKNNSIILVILLCLFFASFMIGQLSTTYPIYLTELFPTLGTKAVSILFLLNCFLIVFLQTPLINMLKNTNKILMIGLGAFLLGCGMLLLNFSSIFLLAILSEIIFTAGEMIFYPIAQLACYQNGGEKKKGQSLGMFQTVFAASLVLSPAVGSYIYQHVGKSIVWFLCFGIGVSCFIFCGVFRKYYPKFDS